MKDAHWALGADHWNKYNAETQWLLPFNYLNGDPVNAYALRHLARQHKMVDIAYMFFYDDRNPKYVKYFTGQMASLNKALKAGSYERIEDGNGVYEAFRSGYRVLNWLRIHNMFLGLETYTDEDQLTTIATLLQHGAHLYERNQEFRSGNHQTRGLSALAMLSILFRDFEGTDKWYDKAMELLEEHLRKEINSDGFQFERTVHYHKSDIGNYYYVYQLARISDLEVKDFWTGKLKDLFITLTKIAYPDKTAPVLSDDTEAPWGEYNNISLALTLGYLLFEEEEMGYFADGVVASNMYWYLSAKQLDLLQNIEGKRPAFNSLSFPETGYFINREGWDLNDKVMIISAGLDDKKPDHQHGDMLGVQAYANGQVILPNYQVRYSLEDLELFKNSMVKNVALVDNELQGKMYTSNKGGSGFGKFRKLPDPEVICWETNDKFDLFVGTHNGFEDIGVRYSRQVIYVRDDFWIVKDKFVSEEEHTYKQLWQGHYSKEHAPELLRASFPNGSGFDILQLNIVKEIQTNGRRGKSWNIVGSSAVKNFNFITVIYPYDDYSKRLDEDQRFSRILDWSLTDSSWKHSGKNSYKITKDNEGFFLNVETIAKDSLGLKFSEASDVYIVDKGNYIQIHSLNDKNISVAVAYGQILENVELEPGDSYSIEKNKDE